MAVNMNQAEEISRQRVSTVTPETYAGAFYRLCMALHNLSPEITASRCSSCEGTEPLVRNVDNPEEFKV